MQLSLTMFHVKHLCGKHPLMAGMAGEILAAHQAIKMLEARQPIKFDFQHPRQWDILVLLERRLAAPSSAWGALPDTASPTIVRPTANWV